MLPTLSLSVLEPFLAFPLRANICETLSSLRLV